MFLRKKNNGGGGWMKPFRKVLVFVLMGLGLGLFPKETEGVKCYNCGPNEKEKNCALASVPTVDCGGEICQKVYTNGSFIRRCPPKNGTFDNAILFKCAEKNLVGKIGGCFDITKETLNSVEICYVSKASEKGSVLGFDPSKYIGHSSEVFGSVKPGAKTCFCKGDLCNTGSIPGVNATMEVSGVLCHKCSSAKGPNWTQKTCEAERLSKKIFCPGQSYCYRRHGTRFDPITGESIHFVEKGCSDIIPTDEGTKEEAENVEHCLKIFENECATVGAILGCLAIKGLNKTAHTDWIDHKDVVCQCKGTLCNNGSISQILTTTTKKPSGVACYNCLSTGPFSKDDCDSPDISRTKKVLCVDQSFCYRRTGTIFDHKNFKAVSFVERGCSGIVPSGNKDVEHKVKHCLKKNGDCQTVEALSTCLSKHVRHLPSYLDRKNRNQLICLCKGDLCNKEVPKRKVVVNPFGNGASKNGFLWGTLTLEMLAVTLGMGIKIKN